MIDEIKVLLQIEDDSKDGLLMVLVDEAQEFMNTYTHREFCDCPSALNQIVIYRYNTLDTIGLDSESYNGASFSYNSDLPDVVYRQLNPMRKLRIY